MIKTKKQMFALIGAFILTIILGTVSYAFFNYTRTGTANTIKTGRISFNHTQGNSINLTNMFPIDSSNTNDMNDPTKVGTVTINVTGDTTYSEGIEYLVTAVNVENSVGSGQSTKELPISIDVSVASNTTNDPATTLGTDDEDYFTHRGINAQTSIYKVLATDAINEGDQLLVGYIKSGATGVEGNIVVKAYIDKDKVVISDTYPAEVTDTNSDGYIDGTPTSFGENKTVFTTDEWNSLQTNGVSFQVKVEANEGTWVEENLSVNAMNLITSATNIMYERTDIIEIRFNRMNAAIMQQSYDAATIKADLTYNDEGKVLAWLEENESDNTKYNLIIASDGKTYLTTGSNLFAGWATNVSKIEFNNVDTSRVISMVNMFVSCADLESIDLSGFDTSNVQNMQNMFKGCTSLTSVDLSVLDLSSVQNMDIMFDGCTNLTSVDLSGLHINNVTTMSYMFKNCTSLLSVDISDLEIPKIESIDSMFYGCTSLIEMDLSHLEMNNLKNMTYLFAGCSSLKRANLSGLGGEMITSTANIFNGCTSIEEINMSEFDFNGLPIKSIFNNASSVKILDLSNIKNYENSANAFSYLFDGYVRLEKIDLTGINTSNATSFQAMFRHCRELKEVDLSSFSTSNVTNYFDMFKDCPKLETIYVSNLWTINPSGQHSNNDMFDGCTSLVGGNGTHYDSSYEGTDRAVIDVPGTPGYLTNITDKPNN